MNTLSAKLFRGAATWAAVCLVSAGIAQVNRSIDGSGNNVSNPDWGAVHAPFVRWSSACYADSISAPIGAGRANARTISNVLFDQGAPLADAMGLSDFCWVFGQFVDHDLTLSPNGNENLFIQVPRGDPDFDPFGIGATLIPLKRSEPAPGTGTSVDNPREHFNEITAFVDGSNVYGSNAEMADWLRTFSDGKLKVSAGNLLPYNTVDLEEDGALDPDAPEMENANPYTTKLFVAGDVRANENPLLASLHTVFVREHNRLCDVLAAEHPDWDDEQLYQRARKINGAILQSILYNEWLPAMGVELPRYTGYDPGVNPTISNVFAAAAFRMGHTLLNGQIRRLNPDGSVHPDGHLALKDAFFTPGIVAASGGFEPFIKGMAEQTQQPFDARLLDGVRNFLFGPPGRGGLDLAAINIERGRERGLDDFNGFRESLGLARITAWTEAVSDPAALVALDSVYPSVDGVDAWVGMLVEDAMPGKLFGPTVNAAMVRQFTALRDGDRYFYLNDDALSETKRAIITATRLSDVIRRNTDVDIMQGNLFTSTPHSSVPVCTATAGTAVLDVELRLASTNAPLEQAHVRVYGMDDTMPETTTTVQGMASFADLPTCDDYAVDALPAGSPEDAVTAYDLYLIGQHLLGNQRITDAYQLLAADANNSGAVSAFDLTVIRRVILGIDQDFRDNASWRTFDPSVAPAPGVDPLAFEWAEKPAVPLFAADTMVRMVAVKVGDVSQDYAAARPPLGPRALASMVLDYAAVGSPEVRIQLPPKHVAVDFTLEVANGNRVLSVGGLDEADYVLRDGGKTLQVSAFATSDLGTFTVRLAEARVTDLGLAPARRQAAYAEDGGEKALRLRFADERHAATLATASPNPVVDFVTFELSEDTDASDAILRLHDALGRLVYEQELEDNRLRVARSSFSLPVSGELTWSVEKDGERLGSGILLLAR